MRNFGHHGQYDFWGLGINGKSSELHAAMGLAVFPYLKKIIESRQKSSEMYDKLLFDKDIPFHKPMALSGTKLNYAYYPILFPDEKTLLKTVHKLNMHDIFPRRYFYPSINTIEYYRQFSYPITEDLSNRVLCLPLYFGLKKSDIYQAFDILKSFYEGI